MRTIFTLLCVAACGGQTELSGAEAAEDSANVAVPDREWENESEGKACEERRSWSEDGCSCTWKRKCSDEGCAIDTRCRCWRPAAEPACDCDGEGCKQGGSKD